MYMQFDFIQLEYNATQKKIYDIKFKQKICNLFSFH